MHGDEQRAVDSEQDVADDRHDAVGGFIRLGATAHDSSAFTGSVNSTGTGTVTYSYYTNNTCTANQVTVNTVTVATE